MSEADNQTSGSGTPSAGGQEHFIPKHRFDEITARLREKEEEVRIKDDLIRQVAGRQQPRAPEEPVINADELGIDPQVAQAAAKIAKQLVSHELAKATQQVNGLIGQMGQELDQTKFLLKQGKEKESYLPQIEEYRQRQFRMTGQWMDAETAYKLIRFDEIERAAARRPAQDPAPSAPAPAASPAAAPTQPQAAAPAGPSAAATRVNSGPAAPGGSAKRFEELTLEEQEARLEEAFREGNVAI